MLFICARWWWEGETIETQTMNPSKKECFFVQILLPTRSFCCRFELPPNDTTCSTVLGLFYSVFDSQLFFLWRQRDLVAHTQQLCSPSNPSWSHTLRVSCAVHKAQTSDTARPNQRENEREKPKLMQSMNSSRSKPLRFIDADSFNSIARAQKSEPSIKQREYFSRSLISSTESPTRRFEFYASIRYARKLIWFSYSKRAICSRCCCAAAICKRFETLTLYVIDLKKF